jgi:hypothetical protein
MIHTKCPINSTKTLPHNCTSSGKDEEEKPPFSLEVIMVSLEVTIISVFGKR